MKKGFTLVELILVIAIIALVSAFTLPLFTSIQEKSSTIVARQHVVSTLRLAKVYAHTMKYDTDWGVHMADTNMTLFRGNDYALRDASYDEIIILDEQLIITGESDVIFSKSTGASSVSGTIRITKAGHDPQTVLISSSTISYQ